MNGRGGPPPSPPISIGRSSNGAGSYAAMNMPPPPSNYNANGPSRPSSNRGSTASNGTLGPPGARKQSPAVLERDLLAHHRLLRDYVRQSQREDHTYQPHNRARDKLLRLSAVQFQELSTDVYDELRRRQDEDRSRDVNGNPNPNIPRSLPPKTTFHPKRNQARQKLASLAAKKFRELATDVLFELERRFPNFAQNGNGISNGRIPPPINVPGGPFGGAPSPSPGPYSPALFDSGRSVASSGSSNDFGGRGPLPGQKTMVINKSTMVEDDDSASQEDEFDSRRVTQKSLAYSIPDPQMESQYQNQIADLEQRLSDMESLLSKKDSEHTSLASDLEQKLQSVEAMNTELQQEVEHLRDSAQKGEDDGDWKNRYEVLEQEFHEQQQVADEVRQEAMESLQEMRMLSERAAEASEKEDSLNKRVTELQDQVELWKSRFTKTKTQLRHMRTTSVDKYLQEPTAAQFAGKGNFHDAKGLVKDTAVTKFQIAIDELLQLSREADGAAVLSHMREVITSVREVTEDIDHSPVPAGGDEVAKKRAKAKAKVSAAANNLITTAKTFSSSNGIAPVSLVDAAASHLTGAVVDLVRVVKIRPTPAQELDEDEGFA